MTLIPKNIDKTEDNTTCSIEFTEQIIKKLNNDKFEYYGTSMEDCTYKNEEDGEILVVNWNGIIEYRNYRNDTEFECFSKELTPKVSIAIKNLNIREEQRLLDEAESKYGFKFAQS